MFVDQKQARMVNDSVRVVSPRDFLEELVDRNSSKDGRGYKATAAVFWKKLR
jgi:hypothetical protein